MTMNSLIQKVSFPSSFSTGSNSSKNPAKISFFFPGKVSFPSSSSGAFISTKNKHQKMQVICMSSNDREKKRIKAELWTLRTKVHKEMRKGNVDAAVKKIKGKMDGFGVYLTDSEAKSMAAMSGGAFVTEAYERYVEAKEASKPKTTPKAVVGTSKKRDKKHKIRPEEEAEKKETETPVEETDAGGGGWWKMRRWMKAGGGHARAWIGSLW